MLPKLFAVFRQTHFNRLLLLLLAMLPSGTQTPLCTVFRKTLNSCTPLTGTAHLLYSFLLSGVLLVIKRALRRQWNSNFIWVLWFELMFEVFVSEDEQCVNLWLKLPDVFFQLQLLLQNLLHCLRLCLKHSGKLQVFLKLC